MPNPLENVSSPESVRILQSALPYIGSSMQQPFHLVLKCLELQNLLRTSSNSSLTRGENQDSSEKNIQDPMQKRLKMLQSIRSACSPEHAQYVDTLLQTFRMQAMIQSMPTPTLNNDSPTGPVIPFLHPGSAAIPEQNDDLENSLKAMLTPQQQAMFQSVSNMLKASGGNANG